MQARPRERVRKRVLALRVLCEQGRASTDDDLLRRLFPAAPSPEPAATVKRALETALAAQPHVRALVDVDALAAALMREDSDVLVAPKRRYCAAAGGRLPRGIFWHIFEYWRCDRDSRY